MSGGEPGIPGAGRDPDAAAPPVARRRGVWTAAALLVFGLVDLFVFRAFLGEDLTEVALLPPLPVYEHLARVEPEPRSPTFWTGVAMNDLRFVVWLVGRNARTLVTRPSRLFDANTCYPAENSLALGEPGIAQGFVAAPAYLLSRDPVATYALLLVALPLISALAMYWVVRDWTGAPAAGIAAGLLYGLHFVKTWEVVHPYVWDTAWTVLALGLSVRLFERARWRDALALAACVSLQIAGSFYALLSAMAIGAPFLGWLVWRHGLRRELLPRLGVCAGLVLLAAWAVLSPYLAMRSAGVLTERSAQYFLLPDWLLPGGLLFLGWPLLLLAVAGLVSPRARPARLRGDPRWVLAASALLLLLLSAGRPVDPAQEGMQPLFPAYHWLAAFVPGLDVIRSPSSVYSGVHLVLSLLAGLGGAALLRHVPPRFSAAASVGLVAVAAGAVLLPRAPVGSETFRVVTVRPEPEALAFYETLAALGNDGPLLEVPVANLVVARVSRSILLSAYHQRRTSDCYNSFPPPELEDARRAAEALPSRIGALAAHRLGFTTVVLHHPPGRGFARARRHRFQRFAARHPLGPLVPLHATEEMSAWALVPVAPGGD